MAEILILYYSSTGSIKKMAEYISNGVISVKGATSRIRTVPRISPSKINDEASLDGPPFVTIDDLIECDGFVFGSPTRFGNMAAPLKLFFDSLSTIWFNGKLVGKPASVFTSSSSMHGGNESTLLSMMLPLFHLGMIIVGLPFYKTKLDSTISGGSPYGVTHFSGPNNDKPITSDEKELCKYVGTRIAEITLNLKK